MPRPRTTPLAAREQRTVSRLSLGRESLQVATPRVRRLRVRDLDDLARRFHGVNVENAQLDLLTLEDFRSLEDVFQGYKHKALEQAARAKPARAPVKAGNGGGGAGGGTPGGSCAECCCCTPCCCCAAADFDPFPARPAVGS